MTEPLENNTNNRKQLSFSQLYLMDGEKVLVKDLEYDICDKICQIRVNYKWQRIIKSWKFAKVISSIDLVSEDEEYIFTYDHLGTCQNGNFIVYSLRNSI